MQAGQEDAGGLADAVSDDRTFGQFKIERGPDKFHRHFKQPFGQRQQFVRWQATMTVVHRLGQGIGDAGSDADHRRLLDAEFHRDRISGLEPNSADVPRQPIGVLRHDLDGVRAVGLEDADCPSRTDAMAVQEHHDLPHNLLLSPGGDGAHRPDPVAQTPATASPGRRGCNRAQERRSA
jgi:hypothetical protein